MRIDRRVRHTSANDCRSVKRGGAEALMGPTGCYCESSVQRPGAKRWSGAIRYRVKVPVMSMMPIPTSNDPEATVITR